MDHWIGGEPLKSAFPGLYQLEKKKRCLIEYRIRDGGPSWDWISHPQNDVHSEELHSIVTMLGSFQLQDSNDGWKYGITTDGEFQVAALRKIIDKPQSRVMMDRVKWIREVPIKVTGFIWRAMQKRIPSLCALRDRGLDLDSVMCSYCLADVEDSDHILLSCLFARAFWDWVLKWCGIPMVQASTIGELTGYLADFVKDKDRKNNIVAICYGKLWWIWKVRCKRVLKNIRSSPTMVADIIKSQVCSYGSNIDK